MVGMLLTATADWSLCLGCDSAKSLFELNSSRMALLLFHPAIYSSPGMELLNDDHVMSIAARWIKLLVPPSRAPSIRGVPKWFTPSESPFSLVHKSRTSFGQRSSSTESLKRQRMHRLMRRDRHQYVATCKKLDGQPGQNKRCSICYHQVFHYVLLKPGIVQPKMFSILVSRSTTLVKRCGALRPFGNKNFNF